jgi:signal transduction histidine kinase
MKLFAKYNRVNIAATILVFIIGNIGFYFVLQYVLTNQLDESLRNEQQEISAFVQQKHTLPVIENAKEQWIEVHPASSLTKKASFRSAQILNPQEKEEETVRQLVFTIQADGKIYEITVNKSATETEDLLKLIIGIAVLMIALILIFNYIINRTLIRRLWQPFYRTIEVIKEYRTGKPLQLPEEKIDELRLLNQSLNQMSDKINQDYQTLKTFTENASHEMQTPLSVIRSKTETLLQHTERDEKLMQHLLTIEDETQKLARLHHSLLLLTKLKNRQFSTTDQIDFKEVVDKKIKERFELFESKNIAISVQGTSPLHVFHTHLAEIIISNLLNNALRYTPIGGSIDIIFNEESISFFNTASGGSLDVTRIFQRFYKADQSAEGTGLGLAIVDEICNASGCRIIYRFRETTHDFTIIFNTHS